MVYTPTCVEMNVSDKYVRIIRKYIGDEYKIPESPYSMKVTNIYCVREALLTSYTVLEVKKNGTVIGSKRFYIDPDLDGKHTFDNNNLCISLIWLDCSGESPSTWNSDYDIYYNIAAPPLSCSFSVT